MAKMLAKIQCPVVMFSMVQKYLLWTKTLNMKEQLNQVLEFHTKFNVAVESAPIGQVATSLYELRHRLIAEENLEYLEAAKSGDLHDVADALGDLLYVICGTILTHGMQEVIVDVFDEIHRSNLSKLDENGLPLYREDGKVIKGPLFSPPNFDQILLRE